MEHDSIKAKIIELVQNESHKNGSEEITLADVLRAIPLETLEIDKLSPDIVRISPIGAAALRVKGYGYWNLTTDYDGQTQEVKEFIGKLLGV